PRTAVSGWRAISSPTTEPGPVARLTAPAGRSASARHSISLTEMAEVEVAGAQTMVLPPASAGAINSVAIVSGQFHGVISAYTPRGTRSVKTSLFFDIEGMTLVSSRLISSAAIRKYSIASPT